jgi:L-amino acid N-acyltransferase YncA
MTSPANTPTRLLIRPSLESDLPTLTAIYGHHVLHSSGTFETEPPSLAEMTARRADVLAKNLPHLVIERVGAELAGAELAGQVQGFAYGNWFKPRPAYRFSVEDSIYLAPHAAGQGLGKLLLAELCAQLQQRGIRKVLAVIGDSANAGSVGVHRALGFSHVGVIKSCGWKLGRWLDVVLMEKTLGMGDSSAPQ